MTRQFWISALKSVINFVGIVTVPFWLGAFALYRFFLEEDFMIYIRGEKWFWE